MNLTSCCKRGFTLIELMVTLGIVAIMMVVAVPSLTRYIAQSKVADAIVAATELQTNVSRNISANESVPGSGNGITVPTQLGRYVASFNVDSDGTISITTTSTASSVSLTLTPSFNSTTQQITWVCAVTNAYMNNFVPSKCRI